MSEDKFVLDRVFNGQMRQLVFLLSSGNQPVKKSTRFFRRCFIQENESWNLNQFVDILYKPFLLPTLDTNGHFKKLSVLFAISPTLRQNIILFLNVLKQDFEYSKWLDYLNRNFAFLDMWSKVILGEEMDSKRDSSILSDDTKNGLSTLCSKFQNVNPFLSVKNSPPNKRRRLPPSITDENLFNDDNELDEDELVAACDKTEMKFNKTKSSVEVDTNESTLQNQPNPDDTSQAFIELNLTKIQSFADSVLDFDNPDFIRLLTGCPYLKFSSLLDKLNVKEWGESVVASFIENIVKKETLSFERLKSITYAVLTLKLLEKESSVSRAVYKTIVELLSISKRLGVISVLCECLIVENYQPYYTDLIKKLFTSEVLNLGDVNILLEHSLPQKCFPWNEEFLTLLDYLVSKKSNLTETVKEMLIGKLVTVAGDFRDSLVLMKLLMSFIQAQPTDCQQKFSHSLKIIVEKNDTFLKKKLLKLLYIIVLYFFQERI